MPLEVDRILEAKTMEATEIITHVIKSLETAARELLKEWLVTRETTINTNSRVVPTITIPMAKREQIMVISKVITRLNSTTTWVLVSQGSNRLHLSSRLLLKASIRIQETSWSEPNSLQLSTRCKPLETTTKII
jgi:hypothetical protein